MVKGCELDSDTLDAILVRLVAEHGTAQNLVCCAQVSRLWRTGSDNDVLWHSLLVRRCGDAGQEILAAVESSQAAGREPILAYKALYIRSVTTQVLFWGQAERQGGHSSSHRAPALLEPDDCRSVAVRQVAAGTAFSCMVRVHTECYGTATCIQEHDTELSLPCVALRSCLVLSRVAGDLDRKGPVLGSQYQRAMWDFTDHFCPSRKPHRIRATRVARNAGLVWR